MVVISSHRQAKKSPFRHLVSAEKKKLFYIEKLICVMRKIDHQPCCRKKSGPVHHTVPLVCGSEGTLRWDKSTPTPVSANVISSLARCFSFR